MCEGVGVDATSRVGVNGVVGCFGRIRGVDEPGRWGCFGCIIDAVRVRSPHPTSWNPVKHGLVKRACDWPWSSFHACVRQGVYSADWAADPGDMSGIGEGWGE